MNTYTMEQREMKDTENQEMLLHFDENFIVYSKYNDVKSLDMSCIGSLELEIFLLKNEIVQTLTFPEKMHMFKPVFSQSGEYFVVPTYSSCLEEEEWVVNTDPQVDILAFISVYQIQKAQNFEESIKCVQNQSDDEGFHDVLNMKKDIVKTE